MTVREELPAALPGMTALFLFGRSLRISMPIKLFRSIKMIIPIPRPVPVSARNADIISGGDGSDIRAAVRNINIKDTGAAAALIPAVIQIKRIIIVDCSRLLVLHVSETVSAAVLHALETASELPDQGLVLLSKKRMRIG